MTRLSPIQAAARQEFEYYGSTLTTNTALRIAVFVLSSAVVLLAFGLQRVAVAAANVKPLVIRINEVGRADAVKYGEFGYKPQTPEIRYFLSRFVIGYYGRNHQTVRDQYVESLYFVDSALFNQIDARDRRSQWLPKFLASSDEDENILIRNPIIEDLETQPYKARVEFEKIFQTITGTETRHEKWTAEIQFRVNPEVPNQMIQHNPLGLAVTYLHEYQAFE